MSEMSKSPGTVPATDQSPTSTSGATERLYLRATSHLRMKGGAGRRSIDAMRNGRGEGTQGMFMLSMVEQGPFPRDTRAQVRCISPIEWVTRRIPGQRADVLNCR